MTDEQFKQLTDLLKQQIRISSQIGIIVNRITWLLIVILAIQVLNIFL